MILAIILLIFLSYLGLNVYIYHIRRQYRHIVSVQIPVGVVWFLGAMLDIRKRLVRLGEDKDGHDVFREYHTELGCDVFVIPIIRKNLVMCYKLSIMSRVLTDRSAFRKSELFAKVFSHVGGTRIFGDHGLLNEPGTDLWATKRKIMDPAFRKAFLRTTLNDLNRVANNLINTLSNELYKDAFDVTNNLAKSALEAVSICGFAWDEDIVTKHVDEALNMATVLLKTLALRFKSNTFEFPGFWRKEKYELNQAVIPMRNALKNHLKYRIENAGANQKDDILSYIIKANMVSDVLTVEDIIDEYLVFVTAGMETTAITMAVALFYLSTHPEIYKRVQDEVDVVYGANDELSFDDVGKLVYLEMVVKECLRLKPPARSTTRQCMLDGIVVDEVAIPKGSIVIINYNELHIDPRYWENPLQFNPDRFASSKSITNYTYMPFSAGNRSCIGKSFAMLEAKVIVSKIIHQFNVINPQPDVKDFPVTTKIVSKPRDGIFIKLLPRCKL